VGTEVSPTRLLPSPTRLLPSPTRLLLTPPLSGALNMALDEVLLAGLGQPVIRVYEWQPHTITLGYGQRSTDLDEQACRRWGLDVTRRLTGGRAVLHGDELTYSVIAPPEALGGVRNISESYNRLCACLIAALGRAGISVAMSERHGGSSGHDPACFASAAGGDLCVDGRKLMGSAQCHKLGGVLQHGSLPRTVHDQQIAECLQRPPGATIGWTCLRELGVDLTPESFAEHLAAGFEPLLGPIEPVAQPTKDEWREAEALAESKYATEAWVRRI